MGGELGEIEKSWGSKGGNTNVGEERHVGKEK